MGNNQKGSESNEVSSQRQLTGSHQKIYQQEYKQTYHNLKHHPDFFETFLGECPNFGKNLHKLFPKALDSPEHYIEMVLYLRRYETTTTKTNKQAEENAKPSTLLDRFFMICLGNSSFEYFQNLALPKDKIQELLLDYFQLFMEGPKPGVLAKAVKYIQMEYVKLFSHQLRQHFPHVQKFLKDYYYGKFHSGKKEHRLLSHFKSKILSQDAVFLALRIPEITKPDIAQLYNSEDFGMGFHSIEKKLVGYTGPWLLLIEHRQKQTDGKKTKYIFGTYQNGPIKDVSSFQGDLTSFMFSIEPNIRYMTTDRGNGGQNYFLFNSLNEKVTKRRKGIGFGGDNEMQNFKLWIDEDMDKSKVFNGNDHTYGYGALAGPGTSNLDIVRMQVWGLGSQQDLNYQAQYWKERHQQIMKRRKVDKKQFFDQSSGLFFEKTLGHRQQVIGQIQKTPHKKEEEQK